MDFKSENIWLHAIRLVGQVSENMQFLVWAIELTDKRLESTIIVWLVADEQFEKW